MSTSPAPLASANGAGSSAPHSVTDSSDRGITSIPRKDSLSKAWDQMLDWGPFEMPMLPPNDLRRCQSTDEELFIWSTEIELYAFSVLLYELNSRYRGGDRRYFSVVPVQDALEDLFLEINCNPAPELVSIDKMLRDTLEQHVKELGECSKRRYFITTIPQCRASYVAVTLSSLIGQQCSHIEHARLFTLQSVEKRSKEIFITIQARLEGFNMTMFLKAALEVKKSSSFEMVGIKFLTGCEVLEKIDDMLESVKGETENEQGETENEQKETENEQGEIDNEEGEIDNEEGETENEEKEEERV